MSLYDETDYVEALTVSYDAEGRPSGVPTYLSDYAELYARDPREAGLSWFFGAHIGVSLGFGLHSLIGRGEEALAEGELTAEQYGMLPTRFNCKNFNAIDIVELTVAAGGRYLAFQPVAPDGFSLYNSACNDYNSVKSAAGRDLMGELASTCEYHGVGLVLEFPLGRNFRRWPQGIDAAGGSVSEYAQYIREQLHELLTAYGPVAAVSFAGMEHAGKHLPEIDLKDLCAMVAMLQPNTLVAFEDGGQGFEDFYCVDSRGKAAQLPPGKPAQLVLPMTPGHRSFDASLAGQHLKAEALWQELREARKAQCNLVLNTALMPDGSLDLEDITTLLEIGQRLEKGGLPH